MLGSLLGQTARGAAEIVGTSATIAASLAYAGARMGFKAGIAGAYVAASTVRVMGRGKFPAVMDNYVPQWNRAIQNTVGALGVGAGLAMGASALAKQGRWNFNEAAANGTLEMEQPHFMGATGSLALQLHYQRHGRPQQQGPQFNNAGMMASQYVDDALRIALR